MITQKVDLDDDILGFTHTWVTRLAQRVERLDVLVLAVGRTDLPANVTLHSMGKERGAGKLMRFANYHRVVVPRVLGRQVDVVFAHLSPIFALLAGPWCRLRRVPLVLWHTHKSVSPTLRLAHRFVDRVVTASPESFRLLSRKVIVTGHGIDTDHFSPGAAPALAPAGVYTVLSVGRISPVKDYETLIAAADIMVNRLGRQDVQFLVVGDPGTPAQRSYAARLREMVRTRRLEGQFRFLGAVAHSRVLDLYRACDVFVNLSDAGSVDKALLEAMACGVPALACSTGVAELLAPWREVLLFRQGAAEDLADKLTGLLSLNPAARRALGLELRGAVQREHNVDRMMDHLAEVFGDLCVTSQSDAAAKGQL